MKKKKTTKPEAGTFDTEYWNNFLCEASWQLGDMGFPLFSEMLKPDPEHLDWGDCFIALDDKHAAAIEKVIRTFAKTKKWPKMPPIVGGLLIERVFSANDMVKDLQKFSGIVKIGPMTKRMSEERMILWFLIETWASRRERLRSLLDYVPYPEEFPDESPEETATAPTHFGRN